MTRKSKLKAASLVLASALVLTSVPSVPVSAQKITVLKTRKDVTMKKKLTVKVGKKKKIKISKLDNVKIIKKKFKSKKKKVATVSSTGKVKGKKKGTAKIVVTVYYKKTNYIIKGNEKALDVTQQKSRFYMKKFTVKVTVKDTKKKNTTPTATPASTTSGSATSNPTGSSTPNPVSGTIKIVSAGDENGVFVVRGTNTEGKAVCYADKTGALKPLVDGKTEVDADSIKNYLVASGKEVVTSATKADDGTYVVKSIDSTGKAKTYADNSGKLEGTVKGKDIVDTDSIKDYAIDAGKVAIVSGTTSASGAYIAKCVDENGNIKTYVDPTGKLKDTIGDNRVVDSSVVTPYVLEAGKVAVVGSQTSGDGVYMLYTIDANGNVKAYVDDTDKLKEVVGSNKTINENDLKGYKTVEDGQLAILSTATVDGAFIVKGVNSAGQIVSLADTTGALKGIIESNSLVKESDVKDYALVNSDDANEKYVFITSKETLPDGSFVVKGLNYVLDEVFYLDTGDELKTIVGDNKKVVESSISKFASESSIVKASARMLLGAELYEIRDSKTNEVYCTIPMQVVRSSSESYSLDDITSNITDYYADYNGTHYNLVSEVTGVLKIGTDIVLVTRKGQYLYANKFTSNGVNYAGNIAIDSAELIEPGTTGHGDYVFTFKCTETGKYTLKGSQFTASWRAYVNTSDALDVTEDIINDSQTFTEGGTYYIRVYYPNVATTDSYLKLSKK